MNRLDLRIGGRACPVLVGEGLSGRLGALLRDHLGAERVVMAVDRAVASLHGRRLRAAFRGSGVRVQSWIEIPRGEGAKSLTRVRALYRSFLEAGADRWTPVVAVGGGVTGDVVGYAASTFMRGMPVVQVPTTVLAQVDSSVGGKTGVNLDRVKNLVGSFHQPSLVVSDPSFLATLAPRDYRAGLVEAVKVAVTLRPELLRRMETGLDALERRDPEFLAGLVADCVGAKGELVARDERDEDVRGILNYGHTVGHALEAARLGRLRHGEAVAVGMAAAAWVGERLGVASPEVGRRQAELLTRLGLKLSAPDADKKVIARNLKLDKKVRARQNRFVLTLEIGGASVWPHISDRVLKDAVRVVTS